MLAGGCVGVPAEAQSPFAKHERVLTTPEGYVCYRAAGPLEIDGRQIVPTLFSMP